MRSGRGCATVSEVLLASVVHTHSCHSWHVYCCYGDSFLVLLLLVFTSTNMYSTLVLLVLLYYSSYE